MKGVIISGAITIIAIIAYIVGMEKNIIFLIDWSPNIGAAGVVGFLYFAIKNGTKKFCR